MEKPEEFIALYNRLLNVLGEDEAVYFADAVHPEYQTKPACGWVKQGSHPAVKTTAGRARINIHGALNLETFDTPFVGPTTVDGVSSTQLLAKTEARSPDKRIIHVIWDNAAYHQRIRCEGLPRKTGLPSPPDPVAAILPSPDPNRTAMGGDASACDP